MSKLIIASECNLTVELPNIDYSQDQLNGVKDIQAILLHSALDKYLQITITKPI